MKKVNLTPWTLSLAISLIGARAAAEDECGAADLSDLQKRIYVKPNGKDVDGCGTTPDNACQTIQRGIQRCSGARCGVLVRYGKYELKATIALASGVSVYGSCEWGVDGTAPAPPYRSDILAPPDGKAAISATKITTRTVLHGFNVLGSDAKTLGAPSIGVIVKDSPREDVLVLQYCQITAGKGAPGAPGAQPGQPPAAEDGRPGDASNTTYSNKYCTNAFDVCEYIDPPDGGRSASGHENGGAGGATRLKWHSQYSYYCDWDPNIQKGQDGNGSHGGGGGDGTVPGAECTGHLRPGDGQPGQSVTIPSACARQGGVTSTDRAGVFDKATGTWAPSRGGRGDSGSPGSGGGGGGSGGSCIASGNEDGAFIWFASGGGGGAGGQGGPGGEGGVQGGPSFALVVIDSNLQGKANRFIQGSGGKGGRGGDGAQGGYGGKGGPGAKGHFDTVGDFYCPGHGADGGGGSQGGPGAGGAGGNGGPSIGLALVGGQAPDSLARIYLSQAGEGGSGGDGIAGTMCQNGRARAGSPGSQGIAERIHKY